MLRTLFQWFDTHPECYWPIAAIPTLLWLASALRPSLRPQQPKATIGREISFLLLLFASFAAWRWPFWLNADPYNPDESQFIAGAITLTRDPIFWQSVDGTTSGPLNFYALLPLRGLGLPLDYFSARLTGLLLVWIAIAGCYRFAYSLYGQALARLAILPIAAFFMAASDADFVHYSSEHVPLALIAIAAPCLFTLGPGLGARRMAWLGGFWAGMLPWAKLQAAPIAVALLGIGFWNLWKSHRGMAERKRLLLELAAAALVPSAVIVAVVGASGHARDLYQDYFRQNLHYLNQNWSLAAALKELWRFSLETGNFPVYAAIILVTVVWAAVATRAVSKGNFVAAGLLGLTAVCCVIAPKRAFLHYALLTVVPFSLWIEIAMGEIWQKHASSARGRSLAAAIAVGIFCAIIGVRIPQGPPKMFGEFSAHWRYPRPALGNIVRALSRPPDRLAVWGWMERIHVDTGLAQATRESKSFQQIMPSPQREHYRERYVGDLKRNLPAIFIDATGPGAPVFDDRSVAGHETVPALAELIRTNYVLLTDLGFARIYVRSSRLNEHPISSSDLWRLIADARREEASPAPSSLLPKRLPQKKIQGRIVQMMLPPAEMVWDLDGTEREIFLDYGFDPKAYQEGTSNGAELIVELRPPGAPARTLLNRSLDPAKRPDDRGNLTSRIVIPPFPVGTKFVVRTTPGEFGDNAWDWVYVGKFDRVRAPFFSPRQFPNYSRIPSSIISEYTSILDENDEKLLMTHAPTTMQFSLTGRERRWQFDYGFQAGAYTAEGHSDGATFIVELKHSSQPATILFSRQLNPATVEADRGRQHGDLLLPLIAPGDQLIMRIDPGQTLGWDWTYITQLRVEESQGSAN